MRRINNRSVNVAILVVSSSIGLFLYYRYALLLHTVDSLKGEILLIRDQKDSYVNELNNVKRELYLTQHDVADVEYPGTNMTLTPQLLGFSSSILVFPKDFQVITQRIQYKNQSALFFSTNVHPSTEPAEWVNLTEYQYDAEPYFTQNASQEQQSNHVASIVPVQLKTKDVVLISQQQLRVYSHVTEQKNFVAYRFFLKPKDGKTRFITITKHLDSGIPLKNAEKMLREIVNSIVPI